MSMKFAGLEGPVSSAWNRLYRCPECGALLISEDIPTHVQWHSYIMRIAATVTALLPPPDNGEAP